MAYWRAVSSSRKTFGPLTKDVENPDAPVFRSRTGKPLDRSRVLRIVQEAAQRAGIGGRVGRHWLRHALATQPGAGGPIRLVQATLGHASVATTSRYLHARPSQSSAGSSSVAMSSKFGVKMG
jgi:site-specific recombinase XerD